MSVKVCPECGAEYLMSVEQCADDGSDLVVSDTDEMDAEVDAEVAVADDREEAELDGDEVGDEPNGDQVAYELDAWDPQARVLLDQLLNGEAIMHIWEAGTTLIVRDGDEERVDALIEQVEVTDQPELDPDKDQIVYETGEWDDAQRTAVADSLVDAAIPFGYDEDDDLVVHEEDEERVETVLDQVDFNFSVDGDELAEGGGDADGDGVDAGDADGLAAQDTMSELFVAADRLMHDADDHEGVLRLAASATMIAALPLPYGFAPGAWKQIVDRSAALRAMLEADGSEDDDVIEGARELREILRQYV